MNRRNFLKNSLMTAATITTFAGLLIKPKRVFAAWPKESFDITDLNEFRKKLKKQNEPAGIKITFLPFLLKAAVLLLKKHPRFNSSLDHTEENLVLKNYYHIGVAVDTNQGLVVPVIRDVDRKSIVELSKELESISKKARNKKEGNY